MTALTEEGCPRCGEKSLLMITEQKREWEIFPLAQYCLPCDRSFDWRDFSDPEDRGGFGLFPEVWDALYGRAVAE